VVAPIIVTPLAYSEKDVNCKFSETGFEVTNSTPPQWTWP